MSFTLDCDKNIQFIKLLTKEDFFFNVKNVAISPKLNSICVISDQRDASFFLLPQLSNEFQPAWKGSSKVQRCFYSDDGKQLLVILTVNSFQVYNTTETQLKLLTQMKASVLSSLLLPFKTDFSAASQVDPLRLSSYEVVVLVDRRLLVCLKWRHNEPVSVRFAFKLTSCVDFSVIDENLFILASSGVISAYNLTTGHLMRQELNAQLTAGSNLSSSKTSLSSSLFCKLAVSARTLLLVSQSQEVQVLDITNFFNSPTVGTSKTPDSRKEKWTWPTKSRRTSVTELKTAQCKVLVVVPAPPGLVVSNIVFTLKSVLVYYSILGDERYNSYKVLDELTGSVLLSVDNSRYSRVVSGSSLSLSVFRSDSELSVCLGCLSADELVLQFSELLPSYSLEADVKKSMSTNLVVSEHHVKFLQLILNLHSHVFKEQLVESNADTETQLMEVVEGIVTLLCDQISSVDDQTNVDNVRSIFYCHLVSLLDHAHIIHNTAIAPPLLHLISRVHTVLANDPLDGEFAVWRELPEPSVIHEAVLVGAVALAHVFLVTDRRYDLNDVEKKFSDVAEAWIVELIAAGDLERAEQALTNMGFDPLARMKSICIDTSEPLMRDLLAQHLETHNRLSADELAAWVFIKQVETTLSTQRTYHAFDHKMVVTAQEQTPVLMFKLKAFTGSVNLSTILESDQDWKDWLMVELYFVKADVALEKYLKPEVAWRFLVEMNAIDLLVAWVRVQLDASFYVDSFNNLDFVNKTFYNMFKSWAITDEMWLLVEEENTDTMTATRTAVLDEAASCGHFNKTDSLKYIVERLQSTGRLSRAGEVLNESQLESFEALILQACLSHDLKHMVISLLSESTVLNNYKVYTSSSVGWCDVWKLFRQWRAHRDDSELMYKCAKMSSQLFPVADEMKALMEVAYVLLSKMEITEAIKDADIGATLLSIPLIEISCQTSQGMQGRTPDVSLYDLISSSNVPADKLFLWQSQNKYPRTQPTAAHELLTELPHLNHQVLVNKYGFKQNLDYIYYLRQARPSFACNLFIVESLKTNRRLTTKMVKRATGLAHGLALRYWKDKAISNACVSFIAMLGDIGGANTLRIHLAVVTVIMEHLPDDQKHFLGTLLQGLITKEPAILLEVSSLLEDYTLSAALSDFKDSSARLLNRWCLPVCFANIHKLPLPVGLPRWYAQHHDCLGFVLCLDIFRYPYEQAIELVEEIQDKILKSHLIRALTRTTLKLSTSSPSKSPPKILLEPNTINSLPGPPKDKFQTFVTNIYTEVLNTIQTFTDRNIVLPWSCEQTPETDVLLTLLRAEVEADTSRALLVAAVELQSPALALLASCFQSDNVLPNLRPWLISAIPTSLPRTKRRDEGLLLVEQPTLPSELSNLILQFYNTGYLQTLHRGLSIFLPDNPITLFVDCMHHCLTRRDPASGLESLKELAVLLEHHRTSKLTVLKLASDLIIATLTRTDLVDSVKTEFLTVLCNEEVSHLFDNYQLWLQMSTVLETTDVVLDFIQLCHPTTEALEVQRCLKLLTSLGNYTEAHALCDLLSLCKDGIILAEWYDKFETALQDNEINKDWWVTCDNAFSTGSVSAVVVVDFYQERANQFVNEDAQSIRNKYQALSLCLQWRQLLEDESSNPVFKEQTDSLELAKWSCCLFPSFDCSLLCVPTSVNGLLVDLCAVRTAVRSRVLTEEEEARIKNVLSALLDAGDLQTAARVQSFFNVNQQDVNTILSCIKLARGLTKASELAKYNTTLGAARLRRLDTRATGRGKVTQPPELADFDTVEFPSPEQQDVLDLLQRMADSVGHGRSLAERVLVCYRAAVYLDTEFWPLAQEPDYITLLARSPSSFTLIRDLLTLANLSPSRFAKFLKDHIVSAVERGTKLWLVDLSTDFHLIRELCSAPSLLGQELVKASVSAPSLQGVELIILAHECFTSTCNIEGIGAVLRRVGILSSQLLQQQQWNGLVQLLVGIRRYREMVYIFKMLRDNDQFEHLLKKGMDQVPGLHQAMFDFHRLHCPNDRPLRRLMTSHCCLYVQDADLWQMEAEEVISSLTGLETLKDNSKTRAALNLAMENYTLASGCYLQGGKVKKALKTSYQAQLVALQLALLGVQTIIRLTSCSQVQALINTSLSVSQSIVVARAYDVTVDWVVAIHERWVNKGDKTFHSDLVTANILNHQLTQIYQQRFDLNSVTSSKAKDRMRQLVAVQQTSCYQKDLSRVK